MRLPIWSLRGGEGSVENARSAATKLVAMPSQKKVHDQRRAETDCEKHAKCFARIIVLFCFSLYELRPPSSEEICEKLTIALAKNEE
ncbi:hypothetical protein [Thalassorhabdomicrobium marinisediminis]|uniref:hypothetical protein n=1 Tax=Thalassorhabdomicrobium marinisediminis TaxID=2170577 RepID=UPI0011B22704|nr:hypothetical protein [Thalassorhabdomicrobium marinisediminis]